MTEMSEERNSHIPPVRTVPRTRAALERGIAEGLHLGAQVYVWHDAHTLADFAVGTARPGVPMRRDSLVVWMSATKPGGAAAEAPRLVVEVFEEHVELVGAASGLQLERLRGEQLAGEPRAPRRLRWVEAPQVPPVEHVVER